MNIKDRIRGSDHRSECYQGPWRRSSEFFGGRSAGYEEELQKAREEALKELEQRAAAMGANAVIGVDIDYEVLGADNGMLMVTASGTAVVVD